MITISINFFFSWFSLFLFTLHIFDEELFVNLVGLCRKERCTNIWQQKMFSCFSLNWCTKSNELVKSKIGNCVSSMYYKRADTVAPIYRCTNNFNGIVMLFVIRYRWSVRLILSYGLISCYSGASSLFQLYFLLFSFSPSFVLRLKLLNFNSTAMMKFT